MAMSTGDRSRVYRKRLKESGGGIVQIKVDKAILEVIDRFRELNTLSRNEVIEDILTTWACDTAEALPALEAWAAKRTAKQFNSTQEI